MVRPQLRRRGRPAGRRERRPLPRPAAGIAGGLAGQFRHPRRNRGGPHRSRDRHQAERRDQPGGLHRPVEDVREPYPEQRRRDRPGLSIQKDVYPTGVQDVDGVRWIVYQGGEGTEPVWTTRLEKPGGPVQLAISGAGSAEDFPRAGRRHRVPGSPCSEPIGQPDEITRSGSHGLGLRAVQRRRFHP